jgi:hypothetical protein
MNDMADQTDRSCVVAILPYRLKALRRRQRISLTAALGFASPPPFPMAQLIIEEPNGMRAGIRHIASGRMTVIHAGLKTVMAMLIKRAASRRGLLEDQRLEAIVVDGDRQVFAGFWP